MPKSTLKSRKSRRSPPKISAVEKIAVCIMRKLYEATGGQPQQWGPSATWAQPMPMRPTMPTRLKGIGSSFPAAALDDITEAGRRRVK
jgi:hypothetical protein